MYRRNNPQQSLQLCQYYSQGRCRYGDACRFYHSDNDSDYDQQHYRAGTTTSLSGADASRHATNNYHRTPLLQSVVADHVHKQSADSHPESQSSRFKWISPSLQQQQQHPTDQQRQASFDNHSNRLSVTISRTSPLLRDVPPKSTDYRSMMKSSLSNPTAPSTNTPQSFAFILPSKSSSLATIDEDVTANYYSVMSDLSDADLTAFKSAQFRLGSIPTCAPPLELCQWSC